MSRSVGQKFVVLFQRVVETVKKILAVQLDESNGLRENMNRMRKEKCKMKDEKYD